MSYFNNIYGDSLISTSINIPLQLGLTKLSTEYGTLIYDDDYKFVTDFNNVTSVIELKVKPYIDMNNYDYDRREWFNVDKYGNTWRHYVLGDYILEEERVYDIADHPYDENDPKSGIYYSMNNIYKTLYDYLDYSVSSHATIINDMLGIKFKNEDYGLIKFMPIVLKIQDKVIKNITDYDFNVAPILNFITSEYNKEFYVVGNKLITNVDLTLYEPTDISISYDTTVSELKVHCTMNTNSVSYGNYTPVVDYYILKLTSQKL